jgi:hypothetical protein
MGKGRRLRERRQPGIDLRQDDLDAGRDVFSVIAGGDVSIGSAPPVPAVAVSVEAPFGRRDPDLPLRGRDDLIAELWRPVEGRDAQSRVRVLYGLGGCGKTSIALELAQRAVDAGVEVWWVTADDFHLSAGMRAVARRLGVDDSDLRSPDLPDIVWRRLQQHHRRWLLVLDNADDPAALSAGTGAVADGKGWIRPHKAFRGLVVVTSRYGDAATWGSWALLRRVESLAVAPAAEVLLDYLKDGTGEYVNEGAGERSDACTLARSLGGLPLALRLAGS